MNAHAERPPSSWRLGGLAALRLARALTVLVALGFASAAFASPGESLEGPPMPIELRPARSDRWPRVCSLRNPVCVRAAPGTAHRYQLDAVAAVDRAWDAVTKVLRVPAPEGTLGDPWDVYLVDTGDGGSAVPDERDPLSRLDRESTFSLVDRHTPTGCHLDFTLARVIAEGSLRREVPATDLASLRAQSEELARLATPCVAATAMKDGDDDAFQAAPWQCLTDPSSEPFDRGASLFVDWIDASFGSEPGAVLLGAWALAPTQTDLRAWRWSAAPTTFDVLRVSLKGAIGPETTFDDVLVRFALVRASMAPRPALAWSVPWPTRARRLAPAKPIFPTGTSYVRIDHRGAARGSKLRLEAQWEDYARMRWVVVKRDAADRTLAELPVTSTDHGTAASLTVEELEGVDSLLIIAQNLGSTEHPFSPNQGEWEPHGWLLTVEAQETLNP